MDPESAWEYEAGIIQKFKNLTVRAAGWFYDIEDFINDNGVTAPGTGLGSNCLYNIDHFRLYGGELEATIRVGERFRATAAYVYKKYSVDHTGLEQDWTYYLPALLPKNKVKFLARYMIWDDGWLELSSRYVGGRKAQKGRELHDYALLDLGFEQKFEFGGIEYTAGVYVNNLTGTTYQEQSGYPMPRQVWAFQLRVNF